MSNHKKKRRPTGGIMGRSDIPFAQRIQMQQRHDAQALAEIRNVGFWAKYRDIEVISNIHDNPELLEVSA